VAYRSEAVFAPAATSEENTLYTDGRGVRITNCRAIVGSRTYSMANVSSVAVHTIPRPWPLPLLLLLVGAVGAMWCGIMALNAPNDREPRVLSVALGIVGALGLLLLLLVRPKYAVRITAAGGESNALISHDRYFIERVVAALNQAIVHRG
jgi:hypothetical protein